MNTNRKILITLFAVAGIYSASCMLSGSKSASPDISESQRHSISASQIPAGKLGDLIRYGRELMVNTAYYIGPEGVNGRYGRNKMNCTNCHQDAGTKLFSFNLTKSHENYPQYRAREAKVLTLSERVNNCIERPLNGRPLPLDSREMVAIISYLKWIDGQSPKGDFQGVQNKTIKLPDLAASPGRGGILFEEKCSRCHGTNGGGVMRPDSVTYIYPPLWGAAAYQAGSSMHRVIKMAQWLKANMPFDSASAENPFLTDAEALDIAAFINNDDIHKRPPHGSQEYPFVKEKPIDYDKGPFADGFSEIQHKYGPFPPIIDYWKKRGVVPEF